VLDVVSALPLVDVPVESATLSPRSAVETGADLLPSLVVSPLGAGAGDGVSSR
jgi:hypothetical protein